MRLRHSPDRPTGAEQMLLADDLVERLWAKAIGQRSRRLRRYLFGLEKVAHRVRVAGNNGERRWRMSEDRTAG